MADQPAAGTLTIDLGARCGWCYGADRHTRPMFGSWQLPPLGISEGAFYAAFGDRLIDQFTVNRPAEVVMATSLPSCAFKSAAALASQIGLKAIAQNVCHRWEVPCELAAESTARAAVLGTCRAPKGSDMKDVVRGWLASRGLHPPSHDAGDALVLWMWRTGWRPSAIGRAAA